LKAAQGLASPRKWPSLGRDDEFVWGLAQGSGKDPYQVVIELAEPAFKCSCPSRKFPCKHGLGLLLLLASQPGTVSSAPRPQWVTEWKAKRVERAEKKEIRATQAEAAPVDPNAQAKRKEKRETNIQRGLDQLDGWLADLVRQGLAATATAGYKFWEEPARRLIDAQAAGVARRVKELGTVRQGRPDFEERATVSLGRLHLVSSAYRRRNVLPPEWQAELAGQIGWTVEQDELRTQAGVSDRWLVAGQTITEEERIITRATYLFGESGRVAKILEFTAAGQPVVSTLALGRWCEAELAFFPGVQPLRALLKSPPRDIPTGSLRPMEHCADVVSAQAARLAANPLAEALPILVRLTPVQAHERLWLRDAGGNGLPVDSSFARGWELVACAGGVAIELVGLWDGFDFMPLGVADANAGGWRTLAETPASHA
jgi:hypothetical protein